MSPCEIVRHDTVSSFAERATPWLVQSEAENNLVLSIVDQLKHTSSNASQPYLVTIEESGHMVGAAFRTPPFKLGLTRMPHGAIPALVNDVSQAYEELPAVMGPPAQVRAFAEAWANCKNKQATAGMRHRIYELRHVQFPASMPPGEMRLAGNQDIEVLVGWLIEFAREANVGTPHGRAFAENHINNKTFFVWEDEGELRTSAVFAGRTPHGVRIGFVYTPPRFRGRGYASACVATVSQRALDGGNQFCCLYADLSNPTSNDIYQRIGYTPVCDVADYIIE